MKVVVSIGGSVLVPDLEADQVSEHAAVVEGLADAGCTVGAVVGGGPTARDYVGTARDLGANEIALDELGIATTRLNAKLLVAALEGRAAPKVPEDYETAGEVLRREDIVVMGGVAPGQTTDAVGAALAEYVDADLLVYATSVPGVFDADPDADPSATASYFSNSRCSVGGSSGPSFARTRPVNVAMAPARSARGERLTRATSDSSVS